MADWFMLSKTGAEGTASGFVNLDMAQSVEIISQAELRIRFHEGQTMVVDAEQARHLFEHLTKLANPGDR